MKLIAAIAIITSTLVSGLGGYYLGASRANGNQEHRAEVSSELSPEVEAVIQRRLEQLSKVAADPALVTEIQRANEKQRDLTIAQINQLEVKWRQSGSDELAKSILTSPSAELLLKFQAENKAYTEIFVTGEKGLNIGQTNKTSDYHQADEEWWVKTFKEGKGEVSHGGIEYDDSSQAQGIALYVPVLDASGRAIGVMKAIFDINDLKAEL